MNFIVVLAIAIGILYWFKQKGIKKDREIEMQKRKKEMALREARQKQEDRETIAELKEQLERLNERLDDSDRL